MNKNITCCLQKCKDNISLVRVRCDEISRFIVTAAHCLVPDKDNFDDITVILGENSEYELG